MIPLLGYPLEAAVERLKAQGYTVETRELRSRKGLDGEPRVVRQRTLDGGTILLTYSAFKTELDK